MKHNAAKNARPSECEKGYRRWISPSNKVVKAKVKAAIKHAKGDEIEPPPKPDHLLEAKRIASAYYDKLGRGKADPDLVAVIAQALLDQQMISHSTPAITGAYQAIQPPPKPDPREEAWDNYNPPANPYVAKDTFTAGWDAAIKHVLTPPTQEQIKAMPISQEGQK